ncbi:MAG: amidohydrolase family protein [Burkholderiales bacterium]
MKTIDIHAHWFPPEWVRLMERDAGRFGGSLARTPKGYKVSAGALTNVFTDEFVDIDRRLAGMDRTGVALQLLSLTSPMVYWAPGEFGLALAQAFNDAASAAHRRHPARLLGAAMLPMQAPELALRELERAAQLPGLRALYLATNVNGTELDDRAFWPIYAQCEALGWPIFLHPVDTIGSERTQRFHLRNLLGNPYDTGVAAAHLILGGVLDAFPRLEVSLPHAGGALTAVIGRLDHGTKVRPELAHMKQPPSAYLRRFTYDTIGHDDRINQHLVRLVGADRVLLGSDYCFDMGLAAPVQTVDRLALTQAERDGILGGNAARLLRLE